MPLWRQVMTPWWLTSPSWPVRSPRRCNNALPLVNALDRKCVSPGPLPISPTLTGVFRHEAESRGVRSVRHGGTLDPLDNTWGLA